MSGYGIPIVPALESDLPPWSQIKRVAMFKAALSLQNVAATSETLDELECIYTSGGTLQKMNEACKRSVIPALGAMESRWRLLIFETAQKIQMSVALAERDAEMYPRHAADLPYFRISMILDDCKRSPHAWLDGFAARWDDDVWKVLRPPFGWGCACTIRKVGPPKPLPDFEPAMPGMGRVPEDVLRAATGWLAAIPHYLWDRTVVPKRPHVQPERWPESDDHLRPTDAERELLRSYGISVQMNKGQSTEGEN